MNLLIHPKTKQDIERLGTAKPHAVLISGSKGIGKTTLALELAKQLLELSKLDNYPYFLHLSPGEGAISIDDIRELKSYLRRKTTGRGQIRRIILLEDADSMTIEAQNALLKSLEEPPEDTSLILTASDKQAILPTVLSRVQIMDAQVFNHKYLSKELVKQGHDPELVDKAYYMSGGKIGLISALLENQNDHQLVTGISEAKQLLRINRFERLCEVTRLSSLPDVNSLLSGLQSIINASLKQAIANEEKNKAKSLIHMSKLIAQAQHSIEKKVSTKLVLTNLFLQM